MTIVHDPQAPPVAPRQLPTIPIRGAGQDLSGGHQGVDVTLALTQPPAGGNLYGSAVVQLLGRDYDRLECRVLAIDGPVMLATSKEAAEQAYAQGAGASTIIPGPWSWLPEGIDRTRRNCDELYAALPGPSSATVHVSVMVSRRLASEPPTQL